MIGLAFKNHKVKAFHLSLFLYPYFLLLIKLKLAFLGFFNIIYKKVIICRMGMKILVFLSNKIGGSLN
jgi:hypothetical protein